MKRLVVVESPTKARTISRFLPDGYVVEASMGHIRDLPASAKEIPASLKKESWSRLGINVDDDFDPLYVISSEKKKVVKRLRDAVKTADELYIATDEDREGESIGWHVVSVLSPKIPVRRMVFHEITETAIREALDKTRDIDYDLVDAQETRRILDRLVGYTLSPLLWKKIRPRLSAGRVQSVAVRLVVSREKERIAFVPASYWDLHASLSKDGAGFDATMIRLNDLRLAIGKDFDDQTGKLKSGLEAGRDLTLLSEARASELAERLPEMVWTVTNVEERTATRSPAAPFITSTLQQEGSRKLNLSARETMRVAQRLYEQGYITYMRTDSTNLSSEAISASRGAVESRYGSDYLSPEVRQYAGRVRNAQEAHEAIRPAGRDMKTRDELRLSGVEGALYDLIWKRTLATQMADARLRFTNVQVTSQVDDDEVVFRASGKTIEFPGFFRAYVEGSDDPSGALEDQDQALPKLGEGDRPECVSVEPVGHETKPPARFTEASLIKVLEREGIGRPSTYATIMDTIVRRGYVTKKGTQLVPTFTAFATNNLLEDNFQRLVDTGFTAEMEGVLDAIATGEKRSKPFLADFYNGDGGLASRTEEGLDKIDARSVSEVSFPQWGEHIIRVGRFGPYIEQPAEDGERPLRASVPEDLAPGDVTREILDQLLQDASAGDEILGVHPEHDLPVLLKSGPYGHYVQLGPDDQEGRPKRISVPKGIDPSQVDFEVGLKLIDLPRRIGEHPETGNDVQVSIGRFGPYVQHQRTFASIKDPNDLFTISFERGLELIQNKEARNKPLRVLGNHPETGQPVEIYDGRYGPYVKHQKLNASLPKDAEIDNVDLDQALALLAERAGAKGKKRSTKKSRGVKKAKTGKPGKRPGKKKAAKKKSARESTGRKSGSRRKSDG